MAPHQVHRSSLGAIVVVTSLITLGLLALVSPARGEYNATRFREIVINDNTNDDAIYLNAQGLLNRSGYRYEEYYSLADDGYITLLIRIINPLADRLHLKKPPVLLFHGAHLDPTCYLSASSIQHQPQAYPPTGPSTSSNRSLAFVLANNGFDVWLIGQRGSNEDNIAYTSQRNLTVGPNFRPTPDMFQYAQTNGSYWQYGLDDVIAYEIKNQVDLVLNLTGSHEFFMYSFSLGTVTTLTFLAQHPDYARNCRYYVQMAPAITADHPTAFSKVFWEILVPSFPTRGIGFTPTFTLFPLVKQFVIESSRQVTVRYSLIYEITRLLFGPSPIYLTNLERNALVHAFMPVSFKTVQQYGQQSVTKRFHKFNYGPVENLAHYGQLIPPVYNVSRIEVQNYAIISGSLDCLADPSTVDRVKQLVSSPKPLLHLIAPAFNHFDLIAGVEVDKYVNLPVLNLFDQVAS